MLYIKGKVNTAKLIEKEDKKPYYNAQLVGETDNGVIYTQWIKIYSKKEITQGQEINAPVKVNAFKDKAYLTVFLN
jgi:hypothetical protein